MKVTATARDIIRLVAPEVIRAARSVDRLGYRPFARQMIRAALASGRTIAIEKTTKVKLRQLCTVLQMHTADTSLITDADLRKAQQLAADLVAELG